MHEQTVLPQCLAPAMADGDCNHRRMKAVLSAYQAPCRSWKGVVLIDVHSSMLQGEPQRADIRCETDAARAIGGGDGRGHRRQGSISGVPVSCSKPSMFTAALAGHMDPQSADWLASVGVAHVAAGACSWCLAAVLSQYQASVPTLSCQQTALAQLL